MYGMDGWNKPSGDLIIRAAAIREIMTDVRTDKTACLFHVNLICNRLERLPSAQPERKKGEWIEREVTYIDDLEAKDIITAWQSCKCSVCGRYETKPYMYYFSMSKYCSWCGAEMREVANGNTD